MDPSSILSPLAARTALRSTPSLLLRHFYARVSAAQVSTRLMHYLKMQPTDGHYLGEAPFRWIKIMIRAALRNRWDQYAALGSQEKEEAITAAGWAIWWNEERFRKERRVRHCSIEGLMCSVVFLCVDDYHTELCWACWPGVTLLRHFVYGTLQPRTTDLLERLVRLRAASGHPVELMPNLMMLWSLQERTGVRVDLGSILRARNRVRQEGLEAFQGYTWYLSEENIARTFADYLNVLGDPVSQAAIVSRVANTWRSFVHSDNASSESERVSGRIALERHADEGRKKEH